MDEIQQARKKLWEEHRGRLNREYFQRIRRDYQGNMHDVDREEDRQDRWANSYELIQNVFKSEIDRVVSLEQVRFEAIMKMWRLVIDEQRIACLDDTMLLRLVQVASNTMRNYIDVPDQKVQGRSLNDQTGTKMAKILWIFCNQFSKKDIALELVSKFIHLCMQVTEACIRGVVVSSQIVGLSVIMIGNMSSSEQNVGIIARETNLARMMLTFEKYLPGNNLEDLSFALLNLVNYYPSARGGYNELLYFVQLFDYVTTRLREEVATNIQFVIDNPDRYILENKDTHNNHRTQSKPKVISPLLSRSECKKPLPSSQIRLTKHEASSIKNLQDYKQSINYLQDMFRCYNRIHAIFHQIYDKQKYNHLHNLQPLDTEPKNQLRQLIPVVKGLLHKQHQIIGLVLKLMMIQDRHNPYISFPRSRKLLACLIFWTNLYKNKQHIHKKTDGLQIDDNLQYTLFFQAEIQHAHRLQEHVFSNCSKQVFDFIHGLLQKMNQVEIAKSEPNNTHVHTHEYTKYCHLVWEMYEHLLQDLTRTEQSHARGPATFRVVNGDVGNQLLKTEVKWLQVRLMPPGKFFFRPALQCRALLLLPQCFSLFSSAPGQLRLHAPKLQEAFTFLHYKLLEHKQTPMLSWVLCAVLAIINRVKQKLREMKVSAMVGYRKFMGLSYEVLSESLRFGDEAELVEEILGACEEWID